MEEVSELPDPDVMDMQVFYLSKNNDGPWPLQARGPAEHAGVAGQEGRPYYGSLVLTMRRTQLSRLPLAQGLPEGDLERQEGLEEPLEGDAERQGIARARVQGPADGAAGGLRSSSRMA